MVIGKIYTDCKIEDTNELIGVFSIDLYNENESNTKIPLLIVGKSNAERIFGKENVHVLDKKIRNNIYWTFSKYEKHNIFETDVKKFIDMCFTSIRNNVNYKFFNIFTQHYSNVKEFINNINNCDNTIIYFSPETVYVYETCSNTIYGISIEQLELINITTQKLISLFADKDNVRLIFNDDFLERDTLFKLRDNIKLIPYLFYLNM